MGTETVEQLTAAEKERRAKLAVRLLKGLDTEQVEEIVIGGESELSTREASEEEELILYLKDIEDEIDEEEKSWGKVSGLSTGYPNLDARIGGLKKGELILVGGKPKNGKSAFAQNIAVNVAGQGHPVLFITLELLARQTGVRVKHMNGGEVPDHFFVQAKHRLDYRLIKPLFEQAMENGVELVVLDYLQFMGRGMTNDEVAKMSKEMKTLALEFEVPFIVIVSLRKGDTKFNTKWTDIELDDIAGTSAIGYDADTILVTSKRDEKGEKDPDHLYVKVVEVRSMPDKGEFLKFNWDRTKITETSLPEWVPQDEDVKDTQEEDITNIPLPYKD